MKVNSKNLNQAIAKAMMGVGKSTIPIMDNLHLHSDANNLRITGGDLEIFVSAICPSQGEFNACLPAKLLSETIKSLPDCEVTFTRNEQQVEIRALKSKFKMPCEDGYPKIPEATDNVALALANELTDIIQFCQFCLGNDTLRPAMTGIYWDKQTFVATDAHKLAHYKCDIESHLTGNVIIPSRALSVVKQLNKGCGAGISVSDNNIVFDFGGDIVSARLIDARYPNYSAVIPTGYERTYTTKRDDLMSALRRLLIFANNTTHSVVFDFNANKMIAENIDFGQSAEETLTGEFDGEPFSIAFNARFLGEAIAVLGEVIKFEMTDFNKAVIIRGNQEQYVLVMPIMVTV